MRRNWGATIADASKIFLMVPLSLDRARSRDNNGAGTGRGPINGNGVSKGLGVGSVAEGVRQRRSRQAVRFPSIMHYS